MYVRLGFAVAVHVDPDILLIDEVLAVGDEAFARKCLDKIAEFQREGRTILFVTHSLNLVDEICDRGIVLDHGRVVFDGDPQFATGTLRALLGTAEDTVAPVEEPEPGLEFGPITIGDVPGRERGEFAGGDPVGIRVEMSVSPAMAATVGGVIVVVMGAGDYPVWVMDATRDQLPAGSGTWTLDFAVAACPPLHGAFQIAVRVDDADGNAIGVERSAETFWVRSGQESGLLAVPYEVATEVATASRPDPAPAQVRTGTKAGRGAG
jgi:ABC-2 type transport system ATP-binding protein